MPASEETIRPAIITVDDDPGVSRAVARDLRRRYGERHRIVRAESAAAGLDALRQMKLRGEQVAVILADYRMPELNGIEFLEQAMDIYPGARRVLLTAYADTGAAIDAINVVDLDHYLLKPWDPPEEKLYPVVDALLDAWLSSDHRPVPETKVVGHRWSARSSEVREFLARNQVPYRWYNSDEPEGQRLLDAAGADGRALPVVITQDGDPLIEPTDAELAARVGLATTPSRDFYDLIVIGGGPAGLGAAVYGATPKSGSCPSKSAAEEFPCISWAAAMFSGEAGIPTIMTSYGGYGISMTPQFSIFVAFLMERGCLFALPNIRGGHSTRRVAQGSEALQPPNSLRRLPVRCGMAPQNGANRSWKTRHLWGFQFRSAGGSGPHATAGFVRRCRLHGPDA